MKSLGVTLLALSLLVSLSAQTPKTGTSQPDVRSKPAEKPPVAPKTADPKVSASADMPKPAPEIERLLQLFQGRWATEEKHEPSEMLPQGGIGKGQDAIRPGPGKMSLITEYTSQGPMGEFAGIGLITWDRLAKIYHFHWTDSTGGGVGVMTGRWEGKDLVFTGSDTVAGKKAYSRHAFTNITPTAFTYTIDGGPALAQLKRELTVYYSKPSMEERNRRLRGEQ